MSEVRRGYLPTPAGQVHYRRVDPPHPARTPLVCLHQVPNSSQTFAALLPRLGSDRLVLALDTPGFGMSDPIIGEQRLVDYATVLQAAIGAARLTQVDLLGYHTGAAIAAAIATATPMLVRRVVLCAVPVFDGAERASLGAQPPIPFDLDGDWVREEWRRTVRWRGPGQDDAGLLRSFAEKLRPGARERGATAIAAYDTAAALAAIYQPLLILRPRDDLWEATGRARKLRPDARYAELPDFGHGLFDAATPEVEALLRSFLDS